LLLTEKIVHDGSNYETVMDLLKHLENEPNTYVSFQKYPQLEIWPGQHKTYSTPVGVYAYPIYYASTRLENLPFATQQPYLIIFKSTGNIISNDLTEQEQDDYLEKLKQLYPAADLNEVNNYHFRSAFSKLWLAVVMVIAPDNPSKQNKIFRQLGIDGFNDQGSGTIHPSEQYQAVFFKPQTLQKIKVLDNVLHKSLVGKQPLQKYPKEIISADIQNKNAIKKYTNYIMRNNKTQDIDDLDSKLLLSNSKERDKMAKLIIQNKKYLNYKDVYNLLNYTTEKGKDEIAELIIQKKKDLNDYNVFLLLLCAINKYEIAQLLGSENINKLTDVYVIDLLKYAKNPDEMAKLIIQYKDLTYKNVDNLIHFATDKEEIAELLGRENINKLSDERVNSLLDLAENKYEMAKIIIQYKDLADQNVRNLLRHKIDIDKIAELIIQYKKDLTDQNVRYLLQDAKNKEEIAELLGQENISKLSDKSVNSLLYHSSYKDEMRRILQKYGRIQ
jgi:hypothetical protein